MELTVALRCFRVLFGRLSFGSNKFRPESSYFKLMLWFGLLDVFRKILKFLLLGLTPGNAAFALVFQFFLQCT